MSTAACVFVCHTRAGPDEVPARARRLQRFYAPLGLEGLDLVAHEGFVVGCIGGPLPASRVMTWGAPFGGGAPGSETLRAASHRELRERLAGWGLAIAWSDEHCRVLSAPSGFAAGYRAASGEIEAWASHAVAAAWLAHGDARIDPTAVPLLLAFDFVGTGRSLISDTIPVEHAARIDLRGRDRDAGSYWPARERWDGVAEDQAQAHAEHALLASLETRLDGCATVGLGLTAGADSRVLAIALQDLGIPARTFTWGEPGWAEVTGAAAVAHRLGLPWSASAVWRDDDAIAQAAALEARWTDGCAGAAASIRQWPGTDAVVLGAAGEVGRAFYYGTAPAHRVPRTPDDAAGLLYPEGRLPHADREAQQHARDAATIWAREAESTGHEAWRILDVLYAEQRVTHWGRTQVPLLGQAFIGGFLPVEVMRGLISLPLEQRLDDGFHRAFVEARRPELALPPRAIERPPPRTLRRRIAGRLARLRPPAAAPPAANAFLLELWNRRPYARGWVAEEILGSGLLHEALGDGWGAATRAGFLRGEERATTQALLACGPVALEHALAALRRER